MQQRRLIHWHDRGLIRTLEPHVYALFNGMRLVVVAFEIADDAVSAEAKWKVLDAQDGIEVDVSCHFKTTRVIPDYLLSSLRYVLAVPGPQAH